MIRVTFTAARALVGMHAEGDSVTLEFSTSELTEGRKVSRDVQEAIGGARETLLHSALRTWSVTTQPLVGGQVDAAEEFLASLEGGEEFTAEWWRWGSSPALDVDFVAPRLRVAEAVVCVLSSEGFQRSRLMAVGTGGADDYYALSFTAIEVPA